MEPGLSSDCAVNLGVSPCDCAVNPAAPPCDCAVNPTALPSSCRGWAHRLPFSYRRPTAQNDSEVSLLGQQDSAAEFTSTTGVCSTVY